MPELRTYSARNEPNPGPNLEKKRTSIPQIGFDPSQTIMWALLFTEIVKKERNLHMEF